MSDESPGILSDALSGATQGAVADLNAANAPEPQPQAQEPQQQVTNDAPVPTETSNEPPPWSYEFDHEGQKVQFNKDELNQLLRFGINAYRQAYQEYQQQQQQGMNAPPTPQAEPTAPQAQGAPQQDIQKLIQAEIERAVRPHVEKIQKWEKDLSLKQIYQEVDEAALKNEVVKGLISDPKFAPRVKAWIMQERAANPDLSWESAAQQVAEMFDWKAKQAVNSYVQKKVEQTGKRVEGSGGAAPAPGGKKLGPEDIFNRNMEKAVLNDLMAGEGS